MFGRGWSAVRADWIEWTDCSSIPPSGRTRKSTWVPGSDQGYHRIEKGSEVSLTSAYGRYVDRLEKHDGNWRISKRTVVMEHLQTERNIQCGELTMDQFRRGRRTGRLDLSYEGRTNV